MTETSKLSLPVSGYQIITKMLHTYSLAGEKGYKLDEIAKASGIDRTLVSKNHGFLTSLNVITKGNTKKLTSSGKSLAVAISNEVPDDIAKYWREILEASTSMEPILNMLTVQKSFKGDDLRKKIASTLELSLKRQVISTGVNCVIEILKTANVISEKDGVSSFQAESVSVLPGATKSTVKKTDLKEELPITQECAPETAHGASGGINPEIHIDIQIHISADASKDQIDQIFKSMADHLPLTRK